MQKLNVIGCSGVANIGVNTLVTIDNWLSTIVIIQNHDRQCGAIGECIDCGHIHTMIIWL